MVNPVDIRRRRTRAPGGQDNMASLRRHAMIGIAVMAALFLGLGGWVTFAQVESAVIASGIVVVEGGSRTVQHPEGGIVRQILVTDNDKVAAGDLLVTLDDVSTAAELEVLLTQLRDALGNQARLSAESLGQTEPSEIAMPEMDASDPKMKQVMAEQVQLIQTRRQSLDSAVSRINELIAEKEGFNEGQQAQIVAGESQLQVVTEEMAQLQTLAGQDLVTNERLNEVRLRKAEIEGQLAGLRSSIASTNSSIAELRLQEVQTISDFRAQALSDLQLVSKTVAETTEKVIAARDRLARLEIRAPIDGTVHESKVQTIGGVVSPGEVLMLIVPRAVHLVVDLRVKPSDVSRLHVGQTADIRLLSFNARTTPLMTGFVDTISPDLLEDKATGVQYFAVRVDVADSEQAKLPAGSQLATGMPAEGFFQTGQRSVWSYLLGPLQERFLHTFREN